MIQTLKNVKEYKEELIRPAIREMLEALDIARDLRPGMKVVIKPNLVMAKKPEAPVTTHPLVVKAGPEALRNVCCFSLTARGLKILPWQRVLAAPIRRSI